MNIISGDTLSSAAKFVDGFGKTVEPLGDAAHNVLSGIVDPLQNGFGRKARTVEFKDAEYQDGEDWTVGKDGSLTVHASVAKGGTTVDLPEPVEFIHFGYVYRDDSHSFSAAKLDDTASTKLAADSPAHGLMFRAGLMRETVLLGGFIRSQMDALIAEEKDKGVIGVLGQILADVTGSAGGTADKPSPVDLNPHIQRVIEAGKRINVASVDYPTIHGAGIDLQVARKAYRQYLVDELAKRQAPAKTPTPGGGLLNAQVPKINDALSQGNSWLNLGGVVPKLTALVPSSVQDFLSVLQKISFKAWDVYASLIYEYSIRLEPIIEVACRDITVSSIKKKAVPIFPVWFMEAQTFPALPADLDKQIFDKVDNPVPSDALPSPLDKLIPKINDALKVVTGPIDSALHSYDSKVGIDKTLDFLSRPDAYTPGRPFLDDIFLIPPDPTPPNVPNADKRARTGWSTGLGDLAVTCLEGALQTGPLPHFIEWIVSKVSTISAEFVRGVYCRLLTLKDTDNITEDEIIEAAERHFVGNVIESILGGLSFVEKIRNTSFDVPFIHVTLSVDALIGRAKEFASQKLDEFVKPVIQFAMRDLYQAIFAYRGTAIHNKANTMEVHLAQLPSLFARLFRNVFFPLWDKVIDKVLDSITGSLMPKLQSAVKEIAHARDEVDNVRLKITKSLAALDSLPAKLPDVGFDILHPKDSVDKLKNDFNPIIDKAKKAYDGAKLNDPASAPKDKLETSFPLQDRMLTAAAVAVTDDQLKKVEPALKWQVPKAAATDANAANGAAAKDAATPNNASPSSGSSPSSPPALPAQPFAYQGQVSPSQSNPQPSYAKVSPPQQPAAPLIPLANKLQAPPPEHTQQFEVPQDLHNIDPEETVDLPGSAMSVLLPFQGNGSPAKKR